MGGMNRRERSHLNQMSSAVRSEIAQISFNTRESRNDQGCVYIDTQDL